MRELRTPFVWLTVPDVLVPRDFLDERLPALVRADLNRFLRQHWTDPELAAAREQIVIEAGATSYEDWSGGVGIPPELALRRFRLHVQDLLDRTASSPGLRRLVLTLYFHELHDGQLGVPLCDDASLALSRWTEAGKRVVVLHPWPARLTRALLAQGLDADLRRYFADWLELPTPPTSNALTGLLNQTQQRPADVTLITSEPEVAAAATAAGLDAVAVCRDAEPPCPAPRSVAALTDLVPSA